MSTTTVRPADIDDDLTRRKFLGGLGALGLLGACADDDDAADTGSPAASATPTRSVRIEDDRGGIDLPAVPSRIISLGEETSELLVVLGVQPVGVGARSAVQSGDALPSDYYLTESQIGRPKHLGVGPFNLELMASLDPDLIIHYFVDEAYGPMEPLERIAPTILLNFFADKTWQEQLRRLAVGLGKESEAAAAIAQYEGAVTAGREKLKEVVPEAPRVSLIWPDRPAGTHVVYGRKFPVSVPLAELGFALVGLEKAAVQQPDATGTISAELLGTLDTDTILTLGPKDWRETAVAPVLESLDIPVLWATPGPAEQPTAGPITSLARLNGFVDSLAKEYL